MLEIYVCDHDEIRGKRLWGLCREQLAQSGVDVDTLRYTETPAQLAQTARECVDLGLFLTELLQEEQLGEAVQTIHEQNAGHYLVLTLNRIEDLFALVPPYYRPSGYLLHPVQGEQLSDTLAQIYADYRRQAAQGSEEIFSFRIKAQEYRIPYRNILYFESANKKLVVHTATQEFTFSGSLEQVSTQAPITFLRIHKSFCVNLTEVSRVNYAELAVTLRDGTVVFTSRTYKAQLQQALAEVGQKGGVGG